MDIVYFTLWCLLTLTALGYSYWVNRRTAALLGQLRAEADRTEAAAADIARSTAHMAALLAEVQRRTPMT